MNSLVFACQNTNKEDRYNSSSGGIFPLLAKVILQENGLVYGAAFSEDFMVHHISIESINDIPKLTGSKYVFSTLGKVFPGIKEALEMGKQIAFCGTPCQIAGLRAYLKKEYDNLLLIDFICHGTPPQEIWEEYLKEVGKGRKIINVNFRDKSNGWLRYNIKIKYDDGSVYMMDHGKDPYIKGFALNYTLRNACYSCQYKGVDERQSDITLGDLWGAEELCPSLFDDIGTSLLMIHTKKGKNYFDKIEKNIVSATINVEKALAINWAAVRPVEPNKNIAKYQKTYKKTGNLINSLDKYVNPNIIQRIINKIQKK